MNVPNLWADRKGSIAVEFVAISLVLVTFIFFFADLVVKESTSGAMDRLSYSMAGILRERTQLYNADERISQADVDQLWQLAEKTLRNMNVVGDASLLQMDVQEIHFQSLDEQTSQVKADDYSVHLTSHIGEGTCQPDFPLEHFRTTLAPVGSYERIVPIVQVTVCLPSTSWFSRLFEREKTQLISSHSIVMVR
jgi:tight adherence protein F